MAAGELLPATINALRRVASRCSVLPHEAEDLVQDVLLAAISKGRDCSDPAFLPWASGAIRNHAKFVARTAVRRKRRDAVNANDHDRSARPMPRFPDEFVNALPRAQRVVALLINLGMGRREIAYLLDLSDVAMRQRIAGLRKAVAGSVREAESDQPTDVRADGLARRGLKALLPGPGAQRFAVRDPDGLPIFFSTGRHVLPGRGNI